jgi:uncharacterized cupin superfamily protein
MSTTTPIVHVPDAQLQPRPPEHQPDGATRGRFGGRIARLRDTLGLTTLGVGVVAVPPGHSAWPYHSHRVNDELFYILEGRGELRLGAARHPVRAGDLVGCPAGGPETAHQLVNTGDAELRYLAISSERDPEICQYPDSGKVGVYHGDDWYHMARDTEPLDYWQGE